MLLIRLGQGKAAPIDHPVDPDCRVPDEELAKKRLPARFEIYAGCKCSIWVEAVGFTENGVWTRTELLSPDNAISYPHENQSDYCSRLACLARHPGHVAP
jgi:hypothetical protein